MSLRRVKSDLTLSSTANMARSGIQIKKPRNPFKIKLALDPIHANCLRNLDNPLFNIKLLEDPTSIADFEVMFDRLSQISSNEFLWQLLTIEQKLAIEHYKLAIMQAVENDLHVRFFIEKNHAEKKQEEKNLEQNKISRKQYALFGLILAVEIIPAGFGCFLGLNQLMGLIPGVDSTVIKITSAIATSIECFMYYSQMNPYLKNIGYKQAPPQSVISEVYENRLDTMERLNKQFVRNEKNLDFIGPAAYSQYAGILRRFNQDMAKTKVEPYEESSKKTALRWSLNCINTALNTAGIFFLTHSILVLLAASLIGTPAGWAIISAVVIGNIAARLALRQDSVYNLINPNSLKHDRIQTRINEFEDETPSINYTQLKQLEPLAENAPSQVEGKKPVITADSAQTSAALETKSEAPRVAAITLRRASCH